jgi:hypothetical protein
MNLFDRIFSRGTAPAWAIAMMREQRVITNMLREILERQTMTDRTIDDVLNEISAERTQVGSLIALNNDYRTKLAAALATVTIPADVQEKINQVFDAVEANKADLATAINVNTPAANIDPTAAPAA